MKAVSSAANPDVKRLRALSLRKNREESGLFLTEGLRHAVEAMEAGWTFDTLLIEESALSKDLCKRVADHARGQGAQVLLGTPKVMESVTKRDNAQSVVAALKQRWADPAGIKDGVWTVLEEVRDPGNLGTIIRTADATGARGIILIGSTCDPFSTEAIRASMGSFARVAVVRMTLDDFIARFGASSFRRVGTHLKTTTDFRAADYGPPLMLVMGNEQAGLTDRMAAACTDLVKIPMRGKADSLNLSVATALMLYEAARRGF